MITLTSETIRTAVAAVALHASKDETRPHLTCVLIDQKDAERTEIVATNGHTLARYTAHTVGNASPARVTLPTAIVTQLVAHAKKNKLAEYVVTDSTVTGAGCSWTFISDPSPFPPFAKVIPQFNAGANSAFFGISSKYAALASKSFELAYAGAGEPCFAMHSAGPLDAILCATDGCPLTVVVMPVRMKMDAWETEVKLSKTGRVA